RGRCGGPGPSRRRRGGGPRSRRRGRPPRGRPRGRRRAGPRRGPRRRGGARGSAPCPAPRSAPSKPLTHPWCSPVVRRGGVGGARDQAQLAQRAVERAVLRQQLAARLGEVVGGLARDESHGLQLDEEVLEAVVGEVRAHGDAREAEAAGLLLREGDVLQERAHEGDALAPRHAPASGRSRVNVVPRPPVANVSVPPWSVAILWLTLRPSPVPSALVVKKGVNRCGCASGGMPGPSSSTSATTRFSRWRVRMVTRPPRGRACTALRRRLRK